MNVTKKKMNIYYCIKVSKAKKNTENVITIDTAYCQGLA